MKKIFAIKKISIFILLLFLIMQFFRVDMSNPNHNPKNDLIVISNPNIQITTLLKSVCYDCHSYETRYPWYFNVSPLSWWLKNHITEGREELNFSLWGNYNAKRREKKLEECSELIDEQEMPLTSYSITHPEAKLSIEQRDLLVNWFKSLRKTSDSD